jgi:hypothetical protein
MSSLTLGESCSSRGSKRSETRWQKLKGRAIREGVKAERDVEKS